MKRNLMRWNKAILAAVFSGSLGMSLPASAGCEVGAKTDGSTAESAKKQFEAAGFHQVTSIKKGCDNFWHARATKDGTVGNVVLSPQGQVSKEGD